MVFSFYQWGTRFLCDSENTDAYFYLLTVYTGLRRDGGTKSNVNFIVGGEDGDTGVRVLSDGFMTVVYHACE